MALKNELNSLDLSDQENMKAFLGKLIDKIEKQDTIINPLEHENSNLREKQVSLEELVNELGRYSSKNCLTFLGLLPMEDKNPLSAVLNLLNKGLGLPIQAQDIGSCHFFTQRLFCKTNYRQIYLRSSKRVCLECQRGYTTVNRVKQQTSAGCPETN